MTTPTPDPTGPRSAPTTDDAPTSPVDVPSSATPEPPAAPPAPAGAPPAPAPGSTFAPSSAGMPPPASTPPPGTWGAPATPGVPPPGRPAGATADTQPALVIGIILVIVGGVLLLTRVADVALGAEAWPLWIIVPGVAMLVASFFVPPRGGLGLAIPGTIIATVGLILWVQQATDAWASWTYAWALVAPTAPGLGTMLYGLARGDRELASDGLRTTLVGLALFGGFALFFEGILGLSGEPIANLDEVLPYLLIGLGILMVVLAFVAPRRRERRAR